MRLPNHQTLLKRRILSFFEYPRVPTVAVFRESSLPALFFSGDVGLLPVNGSPDISSQGHHPASTLPSAPSCLVHISRGRSICVLVLKNCGSISSYGDQDSIICKLANQTSVFLAISPHFICGSLIVYSAVVYHLPGDLAVLAEI